MDFSSLLWSIPFIGIIFSMSIMPLIFPNFWHRHSCYVPLFWALVYAAGVCYVFGFSSVFYAIFEPIFSHYITFIVLIAALYVTSGGIFVDFPRGRDPLFNVCFLFVGSMLAGWIGTTGASVLLIRPFLRANAERKYRAHLLVFFIFLIANIGGAATPLGDPPLFIGFLEGVEFFWFIKHLFPFLICTTIALCLLFFAVDVALFKIYDDMRSYTAITNNTSAKRYNRIIVVNGGINLSLIVLILVATICCSSTPLRNCIIAAITLISWRITPADIRTKNNFSFAPLQEVAGLFAAIFITIVPIIHILHHGADGALRGVFEWIAPNGQLLASRCFWASGILSSVLDNAPTFMIFFHMASGNAAELMTSKANILTAISISTVFMGALTYIGNAPNLMVKSIAEDYGIDVPSFFGYMLWSIGILVPIFWIISNYL